MMVLKDVSFHLPQENILYDDVLLKLAEDGHAGETMRFWESGQYFVVLGRIGNVLEDVKIDAVQKKQIPVLRRSSGGGTVVQGPGCLNYSLILSKNNNPSVADLRKSYQFILGSVIKALEQLGCQAYFCPISDIALIDNDRKISGNAQKRSKKYILHHGTILYDFDLSTIETYLKFPKDIPRYRQGRAHLDFVSNVLLAAEDLKTSLKKIFKVNSEETKPNQIELELLQQLLNEREINIDLSSNI